MTLYGEVLVSIKPAHSPAPKVEVTVRVPPEPKGIGKKQAKASAQKARKKLEQRGFSVPVDGRMKRPTTLSSPSWGDDAYRGAREATEAAFDAVARSGILRQVVNPF